MPKVYRIQLTDEQMQELDMVVKRDKKPYARERAAAILKVSAGNSLRQVAYHQLLTRHAPETVKTWCERYLSRGKDGLYVDDGRGRKAQFSPSNS